MRVVVALGGNAISRRGQAISVPNQVENIAEAAPSLAEVGREHELVVTHGNGPQVGLLALQNAAYPDVPAYPLDVLGAETQGMLGYLIERELRNELAGVKPVTGVVSLVEVDRHDPAFAAPTKFVGPTYTPQEAQQAEAAHGWVFGDDGGSPRRVVPSPAPQAFLQADAVELLLAGGHVVIAGGGGGVPVVREADGRLSGIEVVIDKDATSATMALAVKADRFVMATDADAVVDGWGTPQARSLRTISAGELAAMEFAAGSMGPKVEAACRFVRQSGGVASIGRLSDLSAILAGTAGTSVTADGPTTYWE